MDDFERAAETRLHLIIVAGELARCAVPAECTAIRDDLCRVWSDVVDINNRLDEWRTERFYRKATDATPGGGPKEG